MRSQRRRAIALIALIVGMHRSPISSVAEIVGLNGIFVALFAGSAGLFWYAARKQTHEGAESKG